MRRQHGVLQRVFGVFGRAGGQSGKAVQLTPMASEELAEGVAVTGDMGGQQLGITALLLDGSPEAHGRTVTNRLSCGTSLEGVVVECQEAA